MIGDSTLLSSDHALTLEEANTQFDLAGMQLTHERRKVKILRNALLKLLLMPHLKNQIAVIETALTEVGE